MTDPSGYAKTLALPAGFDAPRLLRYDDVLFGRVVGGSVRSGPVERRGEGDPLSGEAAERWGRELLTFASPQRVSNRARS